MTSLVCNPATLKTLPVFSALSDTELRFLVPHVQRRTYTTRQCLVRAGEHAGGLFVIASGRATVSLEDGHGREIILAVIGPNDLFGEVDLFDAPAPPLRVEANELCEAWFIPDAAVLEVLEQNPRAAMLMMRLMAKRLADAQRKIGSLGLLDVYGRVASVLIDHGREADGHWLVEPGSERIAAMVGASREMVTRVVKDMVSRGIVRRARRQILVLDRAALMSPELRHKNARGSSGNISAVSVWQQHDSQA